MTGPIEDDSEIDRRYDEPGHPIPALQVIDVWASKNSGGAVLLINVASPLRADEQSQERLLRKIEGYLDFTRSEEFLDEVVNPTLQNTFLIVKLHPDSDPAIQDQMRRLEAWVAAQGMTLKVEMLDL